MLDKYYVDKCWANLEEPLDESPNPFLTWVGFNRFEQQIEEHHLSLDKIKWTQIFNEIERESEADNMSVLALQKIFLIQK